MPGSNEDYIKRLRRDGQTDLIDQIEAGSLSVYAAATQMGYRKKKATQSRSEQIEYHWSRASKAERTRFVVKNIKTVGAIVSEILDRLKAAKNES